MTWRIGSVPYLNARPLVYGMEGVTLCEPAQLAEMMHRRELDVGLVPVAEVLAHDQYDVVDGIAIASRGPVRSVYLVHREPLEAIRRVAVTPASRTSVWLLQVILRQRHGLEPEFYPRPPGAKLSEHEAMMLIGDEAIWYATQHRPPALLDLGAAWWELTGLPFVYAAWAVQRGQAEPALVKRLQQAKRDGLAHLDRIVQDSTEATAEFRRAYLSKNVCFDLGPDAKQGINRFQETVCEMGLITKRHDIRYLA